jgi:hypothetical protein
MGAHLPQVTLKTGDALECHRFFSLLVSAVLEAKSPKIKIHNNTKN